MTPSCFSAVFALCAALVFEANAHAGTATAPEPRNAILQSNDFEVPHLEIAAESAYLLSILGNPNNYEIGANLSPPDSLGYQPRRDSWFRLQSGVFSRHGGADFRGQRIVISAFPPAFDTSSSGPAGGSSPHLRRRCRLYRHSTDAFRNGQGQDFTFNILTATGLAYRLGEHENQRRYPLPAPFEWRQTDLTRASTSSGHRSARRFPSRSRQWE